MEGGPNIKETVKEPREERLEREYGDAVVEYRGLVESSGEAQAMLFRGSEAVNAEQYGAGMLDTVRQACEQKADSFAEKGERGAERAMRMLEQMKQAQEDIFGLYCDALHDSEELAELIRRENPWVATHMTRARGEMASHDE